MEMIKCTMKKTYMCSLCRNGILGGGLYLDSQAVTYKTQKLTVNEKYRNLIMPFDEIKDITWGRAIFPVATFNMKNGESYKFIIFNKKRFIKDFRDCAEIPAGKCDGRNN
ncbi:MAG: hypothetical protein PUB11_05435 [Oscillospiraceae bacterium]|nr:hypothetical protein [Oscillospiraceae bacterium]